MLLTVWLLTACTFSVADQVAPTSTMTASSTTATTTTLATTTTTTMPVTTTTTDPGPILGLITPTGVPVSIQAFTPDGYLVYTPCGQSDVVAGGEPIYQTTVVLDPGHGGVSDTGAVGRNGLAEKDLNLSVARHTQRILVDRGIDTILTRTGDYGSVLGARTRLADTLAADVLVSIHHNAPTPARSEMPGVEIFIQSGSDESKRLGGLLWEHTMSALSAFDIPWTRAEDAAVMTVHNTRGNDAYGMIRGPETPTALLELGYISNPVEAELFATPQYQRVAGRAVADAIETYLTTDEPGSGFGPGRIFTPNRGIGRGVCEDPALG